MADRFSEATIVPGHGPVAVAADMTEFSRYFQEIGDGSDDDDALKAINGRFSRFSDLPGSSSFANTVSFIRAARH